MGEEKEKGKNLVRAYAGHGPFGAVNNLEGRCYWHRGGEIRGGEVNWERKRQRELFHKEIWIMFSIEPVTITLHLFRRFDSS